MKLRDTSRKSLQAGQSSCHATEMEGQESPRTSPDIREVENFSVVLIGSNYKGPLISSEPLTFQAKQKRRPAAFCGTA